MEKSAPSYTIGRNAYWHSYFGNQRFLKKLKIGLPYDPAIPLLGIYLYKTITQKDTRSPMLIAALYTIAKTQKLPNCPSTGECIKTMCCIFTMEY